jgi:hypothetical protein
LIFQIGDGIKAGISKSGAKQYKSRYFWGEYGRGEGVQGVYTSPPLRDAFVTISFANLIYSYLPLHPLLQNFKRKSVPISIRGPKLSVCTKLITNNVINSLNIHFITGEINTMLGQVESRADAIKDSNDPQTVNIKTDVNEIRKRAQVLLKQLDELPGKIMQRKKIRDKRTE